MNVRWIVAPPNKRLWFEGWVRRSAHFQLGRLNDRNWPKPAIWLLKILPIMSGEMQLRTGKSLSSDFTTG